MAAHMLDSFPFVPLTVGSWLTSFRRRVTLDEGAPARLGGGGLHPCLALGQRATGSRNRPSGRSSMLAMRQCAGALVAASQQAAARSVRRVREGRVGFSA